MPKRNKISIFKLLKLRTAKLSRLLHTSRGKDILLFLLFLIVSYGFWLIQKLNEVDQRDFNIELRINKVPNDVRFISELPRNLRVSVRDKGIVLTRFAWGGTPKLNLNYSDLTFDEINDRLILSEQTLNSKVRDLFGTSTQILAHQPDSISVMITNRPPTIAKVIPQIDISTTPECVISGDIRVYPDSVKIFSAPHAKLPSLHISTEKLIRSGVKDTVRAELALINASGTMAEPATVSVVVPVEPLISKTSEVPVQIVNPIRGVNIVLFPSRVKVSYLLPMSMYNNERDVIRVTADFRHKSGGKVPLSVSQLPDYYHAVELSTDSIEYLLEQSLPVVQRVSDLPPAAGRDRK